MKFEVVNAHVSRVTTSTHGSSGTLGGDQRSVATAAEDILGTLNHSSSTKAQLRAVQHDHVDTPLGEAVKTISSAAGGVGAANQLYLHGDAAMAAQTPKGAR